MLGVTVNMLACVAGSLLGLLFRKGIPERFSEAIMKALALCVFLVGVSGALKGENTIVVIISMVLGTLVGTAVDIDGLLNRAGKAIEDKVSKNGNGSFAKGFVTGSLLFCVGAMAIVGSLSAGLTGDNSTLYTKSVIDFFSAMMLTVTLGPGVALAGVSVFVYQGAIALLAGVLAPILSEPVTNEIICAGSLMIVGLSFNMLEITRLKVANYLPAVVFVPVILWLSQLIP